MKKSCRAGRLFSLLLVFMLLSTLFAGVASGNPTPPHAPSGLSAVAETSQQVRLTWVDNSDNEDGFRIERKIGANPFAPVGTVSAGNTSFTDGGLTPETTYTYIVYAYNAGGSTPSNEFFVTTLGVIPSVPTGLSAVLISENQVRLTWTDNANNEDGFKVERRTGSADFATIATVGPNITSYDDTGLQANTTYTYRVRAYKVSAGDSGASNEVTVSTGRPAAPTGLTYTHVGATRIDLSWMDNATNETGFRIERATAGGAFSVVTTVGANVTTFSNATGLSNNTQYTYRVFAVNAAGDSNPSNQLIVSTGTPAAPANLSASRISASRIDLSWTDNAGNETGFKIERKAGTGSYSQIATVGANVTTFSNTGLADNTQYTYRVRANNNAGDSAYSNEATASTGLVPNAPTNLVATTVSSSRIDLSWTDNAGNETGFKIERKTGTGSYSQIATVGANVTTFSNTGLADNTQYTYRVWAHNAAGDSAYSNETTALTGTLPAAPTNLSGEPLDQNRVRISWTDNAGNETGFQIERKTGTGSYAHIATVTANTTSYTDTGLAMSTEYTYRLRAYNAVGNSAYTNEAKVRTRGLPVTPTNLIAAPLSGERIILTWTDRSDDESGFRIERRRGTGSYTQIASVPANTNSYTDTGLLPETQYTYRIRAYNSFGNSSYSNEAIAATPQMTRTVIKLRVGQPSYQVDGRTMVMDTSPIIMENRTLLPIRFVVEALGGKVEWNERELKATVIHEANRIELWVNNNTARVNGTNRLIDPDNPRVVPIIVPPGRTMMPLRFISEALGCKVDWNSQTREITITYPAL